MKYVLDSSVAFKWAVVETDSDKADRLRTNFRSDPRTPCTGIGVYHCLYVALAEREACELVTADDKLMKNLQAQFPFIVALASMP